MIPERGQVGRTPPGVRAQILLFAYLFLINIFDAYVTVATLKRGGQELNPIWKFAFSFGTQHFLWTKLLASFVASTVLVWCFAKKSWRSYAIIAALMTALLGYFFFVWSQTCL